MCVHLCTDVWSPSVQVEGREKATRFGSLLITCARYRAQVKKISDKHTFHLAILLSCIFIIKFLITILCVYWIEMLVLI